LRLQILWDLELSRRDRIGERAATRIRWGSIEAFGGNRAKKRTPGDRRIQCIRYGCYQLIGFVIDDIGPATVSCAVWPLFSAMVAGLTVTATEGFSVIVVDEDAVVSARLVAVTVKSVL